jgi:predicted Holliday junction resolvase-like endonuclease
MNKSAIIIAIVSVIVIALLHVVWYDSTCVKMLKDKALHNPYEFREFWEELSVDIENETIEEKRNRLLKIKKEVDNALENLNE